MRLTSWTVAFLALTATVPAVEARPAAGIEYWQGQLDAPDPAARAAAARGLALSGNAAACAVPYLVRALDDPNAHVRIAVVDALGDIDASVGASALPLAQRLVTEPEPDVIRAIGNALQRFGSDAVPAIPAFFDALRAPDPNARRTAASLLGRLRVTGPRAVESLVRVVIEDPDDRVRSAARRSLQDLGVDLSSHVDEIVAALSHPDPAVREEAADILAGIEPRPAQAVPRLVDAMLQDDVLSVREQAERTLRRMGTAASDASGRLLPALLSGDREQRQSSASTLGAVAVGRDEEVDALVRASIHDRDLSVRLAARGALVRMGRQRPELFRHFVEIIGNPGPAERRAALIDTIGRLGPSAAPAVPSLLVALREGTEEVRAGAARSLGRIGWPAAEALLPLRRAAAWDRSQRVREGADRAIKTIRRAVERRNLEIAGEAADAMASRPGRLPAGTLVGTEDEPAEPEPAEPEP